METAYLAVHDERTSGGCVSAHVALHRDGAHADVARERNGLRGVRVVADERLAEDVRDRVRDLVGVPDEGERGACSVAR